MKKFGHEKLDVYNLSIEYISFAYKYSERLKTKHRNIKDQWLRASNSVPLNIAEGNGKKSIADRQRYFQIARGSILECAAAQDILQATDAMSEEECLKGKILIERIASMLSKMK